MSWQSTPVELLAEVDRARLVETDVDRSGRRSREVVFVPTERVDIHRDPGDDERPRGVAPEVDEERVDRGPARRE
jgi:hypothetical protein